MKEHGCKQGRTPGKRVTPGGLEGSPQLLAQLLVPERDL